MDKLDLKTAFKYPFNRAKGMWNILWIFLPIIGWLTLGGYGVRIVQGFSKGEFKQLPTHEFSSDLKLGFMMLLKAIPFIVVYIGISVGLTKVTEILGMFEWLAGVVSTLVGFFITPMLTINFLNKETVGSLFEFKILKFVFNNLGDYVVALLKDILLAVIFGIMWIVLVGIPAGAFTKNIFFADFYRRRVKQFPIPENNS